MIIRHHAGRLRPSISVGVERNVQVENGNQPQPEMVTRTGCARGRSQDGSRWSEWCDRIPNEGISLHREWDEKKPP